MAIGMELRLLSSIMRWFCVDQSSIWRSVMSWTALAVLGFGVPVAAHFLLECSACDADHSRPYHVSAQTSLSLFATLSFLCLSRWTRRHGLRKFLFVDKLCHPSDMVRSRYDQQRRKSMKDLLIVTFTYFTAEVTYKIWWYVSGGIDIPHYGNIYLSNIAMCTLELVSWLYRIGIIFLVCFLFQILCHLQILRLEEFADVFHKETDVGSILLEHLTVRRNLRAISHRFRLFILLALILVTASQLIGLLMTTRSTAHVDIFKAGELVLCSISIVTGLFICLRSATKVTHRAQSITGLAAKWHICATTNTFDNIVVEFDQKYIDSENPTPQVSSDQILLPNLEDDSEDDDDLSNTRLKPNFAHTISFQKRQALVMYFENNRAGITVYGFMLDRTLIHSTFGIQLALLLWLLNKTIGIS